MNNRTGEVWGFGDNKYGQLASHGKEDFNLVEWSPRLLIGGGVAAVSAGWSHACALLHHPRGAVRLWGRNNYHQCGGWSAEGEEQDQAASVRVAADVKEWNARKVLAGSEHCLCLSAAGSVLAWGWNEHGSCAAADGDTVPCPRQVQLGGTVTDIFTGSAHSFALVSDG